MGLNKSKVDFTCSSNDPLDNGLDGAVPELVARSPYSLVPWLDSFDIQWVRLSLVFEIVDDRIDVRDKNFLVVDVCRVAKGLSQGTQVGMLNS